MDMAKDILTTAEAAKLLGVSIRTAQLLIEGGSIASWKTPGGHRRVYRADVLAVVSGTNKEPACASVVVMLVAARERLPKYEGILGAVAECSLDSYSDAFSASFAIGSRVPAAVIVDLQDNAAERESFLRSLISNPALGHTRIITVGNTDDASKGPTGAGFSGMVIHVENPEVLPKTVRGILLEAAEPVVLLEGGAPFPLAANESLRLAALERAGLVDTPPEDAFDRLTWLASRGLKMPIALLTLLTPTRQWFKSHHGLEITETPRSWSFCNQTILQRDVYAVENLALDPLFANHPAVVGPPGFRFYAGAPVTDPGGFALGALCVMDHKPRTLNQGQKQSLLALAAIASDQIRLRATDRQLRDTLDGRNRRQARLKDRPRAS